VTPGLVNGHRHFLEGAFIAADVNDPTVADGPAVQSELRVALREGTATARPLLR
jgi:hypothetical protein